MKKPRLKDGGTVPKVTWLLSSKKTLLLTHYMKHETCGMTLAEERFSGQINLEDGQR